MAGTKKKKKGWSSPWVAGGGPRRTDHRPQGAPEPDGKPGHDGHGRPSPPEKPLPPWPDERLPGSWSTWETRSKRDATVLSSEEPRSSPRGFRGWPGRGGDRRRAPTPPTLPLLPRVTEVCPIPASLLTWPRPDYPLGSLAITSSEACPDRQWKLRAFHPHYSP